MEDKNTHEAEQMHHATMEWNSSMPERVAITSIWPPAHSLLNELEAMEAGKLK